MVKQSQRGSKEKLAVPIDGSEAKFKGVRRRKWGKYVSEIRLPNSRERIWLGSYDKAEKAARAFDAALFFLRGRNAEFNFPDHLPDVAGAGGGSLTHSEIRAAAAEFANSDPCSSGLDASQSAELGVLSSESPSQSFSQTESDLTLDLRVDEPLLGSDPRRDDPIEFGMFPGIEEFPGELYGMGMGMDGVVVVDDVGLSFDEFLALDSSLWNY